MERTCDDCGKTLNKYERSASDQVGREWCVRCAFRTYMDCDPHPAWLKRMLTWLATVWNALVHDHRGREGATREGR